MNTFRDRKPISKEEFLQSVSVCDEESLTRAIMDSVESINDYNWLLNVYKRLLCEQTNKWIIGSTIVALSELAFVHKQADKRELISIIEPFLLKEEFKDWADNAISSIEVV